MDFAVETTFLMKPMAGCRENNQSLGLHRGVNKAELAQFGMVTSAIKTVPQ